MIIEYGDVDVFGYDTFYIIKKRGEPENVEGFSSCNISLDGSGIYYIDLYHSSRPISIAPDSKYFVYYIKKLLESGNYELSERAETEYKRHLKICEEFSAAEKKAEQEKQAMELERLARLKKEINPFKGQTLCGIIDQFVSKKHCENCRYYLPQMQMCSK